MENVGLKSIQWIFRMFFFRIRKICLSTCEPCSQIWCKLSSRLPLTGRLNPSPSVTNSVPIIFHLISWESTGWRNSQLDVGHRRAILCEKDLATRSESAKQPLLIPQAPWSWQHSMWYLGHTYTKNNMLILWHSDMARHPVFDLMATLSSKPVLWKGVGQGFHGCPLPHLIKGRLPARTFTCLLLRASTLINGPCRSQVELESYDFGVDALPFLPTMSLIISFRSYVPKCLTQTRWTLLSLLCSDDLLPQAPSSAQIFGSSLPQSDA